MTVIIVPSIATILACKFSKSPTHTSTLSPMENEWAAEGSSLTLAMISKLTSVKTKGSVFHSIQESNELSDIYLPVLLRIVPIQRELA